MPKKRPAKTTPYQLRLASGEIIEVPASYLAEADKPAIRRRRVKLLDGVK